MKIYVGIAVAVVLSFAPGANSAELLLTSSGSGIEKVSARSAKSQVIAVDIVSDGSVRGFDFIIPVAKGAKVDTSKCLSDLPKGFQGVCKFNGSEVAGIAVGTGKTALPEGVYSVGHVTFSAGALPKNARVAFHAADVDGNTISSSVTSAIEK